MTSRSLLGGAADGQPVSRLCQRSTAIERMSLEHRNDEIEWRYQNAICEELPK
jgi:hypothetical protein